LKPTRYIESQLAVKPWFAGEQLSMADIQMSFPIFALLARGGIADLPHTQSWKKRVEMRPAWQRAIEQGGPGSPRYVILIAKCCKVAQDDNVCASVWLILRRHKRKLAKSGKVQLKSGI
jgi:hypothetical protein